VKPQSFKSDQKKGGKKKRGAQRTGTSEKRQKSHGGSSTRLYRRSEESLYLKKTKLWGEKTISARRDKKKPARSVVAKSRQTMKRPDLPEKEKKSLLDEYE